MKKEELQKKVEEAGFASLLDYIKANLSYLPKDKKKLFRRLENKGNKQQDKII